MSKRVAVIGAGWSGLAAAVTLAQSGIPVTVFEASRQLGGRARRVRADKFDLDNGQHILIGAYRETLAILSQVGVDTQQALLRLPLDLRYADGFHLRAPRLPYPVNLLVAMWAAHGLSVSQAWAAMRFMARLQLRRFQIDTDCSVSAFLDAHGQIGPIRRYLWEPLCISALNTPPEHASAQVFANVLRDGLTGKRENSDLLLPCRDLGALFPEPAAAYVEAHGGTILFARAVKQIVRAGDGYRLDTDEQVYSHVIVACAPQHAASLLAPLPEMQASHASISALRYEPIYTCYLRYPTLPPLPSAMLGLPGPYSQWVFNREALSGEQGLLAVVISTSGAHQDLPHEQLAAAVHSELAQVIPGLCSPQWSRVIGEKRATFSCTPSLHRPGTSTELPGLLLAGDYIASDYPGTLESAVRSGRAAAALICEQQTANH